MSTTVRRGAPLLGSATAVLLLAGCASGLVFDREQTPEDLLPAGLTSTHPVEPVSTRFLWAEGETRIFAARSAETPDAMCMVFVELATVEYTTACSTQLPFSMERDGETYAFGELAPQSTGWEQLSDSLWRKLS